MSAETATKTRILAKILHVSADFPDPIVPFKTRVIETLLDLTQDQFHHQAISLNRVSPPLGAIARDLVKPARLKIEAQSFEHGTALQYFAAPKGIRHLAHLNQLGDWIADYVEQLPEKPDLIVAHKLSVEGIAVRRACNRLNLPYAVSIQGDSDTKIMSARADLTNEFKAVLHDASMAFPFTPWAWDAVTQRLGEPECPHILLPCPTDIDEPIAPSANGSGLVSVFHLKSHRRKNLAAMARAIGVLSKRGDAPPLAIIGGGDVREAQACEKIAAAHPSIHLKGAMGRAAVRQAMNAASAFVLPSRRETFGLVFIEALFAGVPVIYPKRMAIDGYFNDAPFAIGVEATDHHAIADAMRYALDNEANLKSALRDWQLSEQAKRFQTKAIGSDFAHGLLKAIAA